MLSRSGNGKLRRWLARVEPHSSRCGTVCDGQAELYGLILLDHRRTYGMMQRLRRGKYIDPEDLFRSFRSPWQRDWLVRTHMMPL